MPLRDLARLIRSMRPALRPEVFVFASLPDETVPAAIKPVMIFREAEGLTAIVTREEAAAAGLAAAFPCRMITLNVHSALEAVGFLAAVTRRLAAAGIPVNAVSAFHHDHLFVPEERAEEALRVLENMSRPRTPRKDEPTTQKQASLPAFQIRLEPLSDEAAGLHFKWASSEIGTRHKFGGDPDLLDPNAWPTCQACRKRMTFIAQLDSVGDELVFADVGMVYVFYCFDCGEAGAILRST
jgi:uncharacterized protein